jgi:hypothetical protein
MGLVTRLSRSYKCRRNVTQFDRGAPIPGSFMPWNQHGTDCVIAAKGPPAEFSSASVYVDNSQYIVTLIGALHYTCGYGPSVECPTLPVEEIPRSLVRFWPAAELSLQYTRNAV